MSDGKEPKAPIGDQPQSDSRKEKEQKEAPPISVRLIVIVEAGKVIAHLTFRNESEEPQYLDPNRCGARGIRNAHFVITSGGKIIPYTSQVMLKMRPPKPQEYIKLPPKGDLTIDLEITDVYGWLPGRHGYEAYYQEYHFNPFKHRLYLLRSNVATFTYYKPA